MIILQISLKDQLVKIKQGQIDTIFNNVIGGAKLYNTYSSNKFWWLVSGKYCFTGYNKNDYFANAVFKKGIIDSSNVLEFSIASDLQKPPARRRSKYC